MHFYRALFLLLSLCVSLFCSAQRGEEPAIRRSLPFTTYTTAQGLISNDCFMAQQDGDGYIWVGTGMGICRYNGRTFKHYPAPGVWPFRSARWAVTRKGVVYFGMDEWGAVACRGDSARFIPLPNNHVWTVNGFGMADDTTFLISENSQGLLRLRPHSLRRLHNPAAADADFVFSNPLPGKNGALWWAGNKGLYYFPAGDMRRGAMLHTFVGQAVLRLLEDDSGGVYVGATNGLFYYSPAEVANPLRAAPKKLLPAVGGYGGMALDKRGAIWLMTTAHGVVRVHLRTGSADTIDKRSGLSGNSLRDVFCDREGSIWIASENGLSRLSRTDLQSISLGNAAFESMTTGFAWNDTTFLFSNSERMYRYTPSGISEVGGWTSDFQYGERAILKMDERTAWINTGGPGGVTTGVYDFDGKRFSLRGTIKDLYGGPYNVFTAKSVSTAPGEWWFGTPEDLMRFARGKFTRYHLPGRAIASQMGPSFIVSGRHNDLWMIDWSRTLIHYRIVQTANPDSPGLQEIQVLRHLAPGDYIAAMARDRGDRLWLGTSGSGVIVIQLDSSGAPQRIFKAPFEAFSSRRINGFAEDTSGNIWVSTAGGLDKVRIASGGRIRLNKAYREAEICGRDIFFAQPFGDKLFVGTTGCMSVIDLGKDGSVAAAVRPPIYITGMSVNGADRSELMRQDGFRLRPYEDNIAFEFTGLSFRDGQRITYRYILEGLDREWYRPTSEYKVTYSHVPPGEYAFRVVAITDAGIVSEYPANLHFSVAAPFWRRWWFLALCIFAVTAAVYAVYRYRINQLLQVQHMRERISKDLHDDIGATVSSIGILAEMLKGGRGGEKREHFLETIAEESRHVAQTLSDIVWTINPKNDSLEAIFARMHRYASELFEARGISYDIRLPERGADADMDMAARQHLYLIFKEAVNNLAKYSGATEAAVSITYRAARLHLIIRDNGCGFDTTAAQTGNGIMNMRKRAEAMGAKLQIASWSGTGTEIVLDAGLH